MNYIIDYQCSCGKEHKRVEMTVKQIGRCDCGLDAPMVNCQEAETFSNRANNHNIIPDIEPYRSQIDGSVITSRTKHRNHLKDHGCIEVGNEKQTNKVPVQPKGLRDEIGKAVYTHLGG